MILRHITPLPTEELPLLQGLGRVASEDVIAPWDIPATDKSAMDGYAFSFASLQGTVSLCTGISRPARRGSRRSPRVKRSGS